MCSDLGPRYSSIAAGNEKTVFGLISVMRTQVLLYSKLLWHSLEPILIMLVSVLVLTGEVVPQITIELPK